MSDAKICAIVGAGDFIGRAIALRFAREGYVIFAGRRNGGKLAPLKDEIESMGGRCEIRALDARNEEEITAFMSDAADAGTLSAVIFNIGANVNFPILDTTERVFRKVWEMACYSGFLAGREAARHMVMQGAGSIFFTGATASMRGGAGYAAFASAKFGLRGLAQAMARELGPQNIHVAHLVIDAAVDTEWVRGMISERAGPDALEAMGPDDLLGPDAVGETYWQLHNQHRSAWTHELDIRPYGEKF
ncbi:SDR family NAD(P)-dependent oxidoreductase [Kordiimonas sp.]|uniref:SDR family NAD(P)-dependent oxidoreductase n=1 Tax=Kordiimonas sp. TaxID=1970157 RepID=UPI003A8CCA42